MSARPEPPLLRSSALNLITIGTSVATGLLLSIVAGRAFGPELFGFYTYAGSVAGALALVGGAAFPALAVRLVSESLGRGESGRARRVLATLAAGALVTTGGLGLAALLLDRARGSLGLGALALPVAVLAVAQTLASLFSLGLQGAHRFGRVLLATLATTAVATLAATALVAAGAGPRGVLLTLAAGQALFALACGSTFFREVLPGDDRGGPRIADVRDYFVSVTLLGFVDVIVWQKSEVFFLKHYRTAAEVAAYGVVFALAVAAVRLAPAAVSGALTPAFAALSGSGTPAQAAPTFRRGVVLMAAVSATLALVALGVGRTLLGLWGPHYPAAYPILPVLLLGLAAGNVSGVASSVFHGFGRAELLLRMGVVLAIVNVALDVALIPRHGILGAAIGCAMAQALSVPIAGLLLHRGLGLRYPWAALARLVLAAVVAGAFGWAVRPSWLPRSPADALALVLSLLVFAYIYGRLGGREDVRGRAEVVDPAPPSDPTPEVTVIVPTKNRPGHLKTCLERVLAQAGPTREVIVVDSSDDTATELLLATSFPGVRRVRVRGMPHNRHFAKNQGIRLARGRVLCFLDDDSFAEPGWLERIVAHYADPTIGGAGGRITDEIFGAGPVGEVVGGMEPNGRLHLNFTLHTGATIDVEHVIGCNMSFSAEALARTGGFDLAYGGPNFMEETDLCLRVRSTGYRIVFDPDALVHHANAPRDAGLIRDQRFEPRVQFWSARSRAYLALKLLPWNVATLRYNALGFLKLHAQGAVAERSWGHARAFVLQAAGLGCGAVDWVVAGLPRIRRRPPCGAGRSR